MLHAQEKLCTSVCTISQETEQEFLMAAKIKYQYIFQILIRIRIALKSCKQPSLIFAAKSHLYSFRAECPLVHALWQIAFVIEMERFCLLCYASGQCIHTVRLYIQILTHKQTQKNKNPHCMHPCRFMGISKL